jgi:LysR family transcriptional regulator, regulator for bpeEF and oprC
MQSLQQFLAFAETAKHGSFAAAARELGSAPSTLAKAVSRLEAALGVKLFHRTTRQVSLTPDGERLFHRCQRVLAEVDDLQAEAAGTRAAPSGSLRIDMPIVYGKRVLLPLLARLLERHPALQLDVRLEDSYVDLVRDGFDMAVRVGSLRDSSLVARRFASQSLLLAASPAYLERHGTPRTIEQLSGHAATVFRQPSDKRLRPWQLRSRGKPVELHPPSRLQINDGEGMVAAARLGLGIVQLPNYMIDDEIAAGRLVELLPSCRPPPQPISAVYPSGRLVPPRVRAALELFDTLRGAASS